MDVSPESALAELRDMLLQIPADQVRRPKEPVSAAVKMVGQILIQWRVDASTKSGALVDAAWVHAAAVERAGKALLAADSLHTIVGRRDLTPRRERDLRASWALVRGRSVRVLAEARGVQVGDTAATLGLSKALRPDVIGQELRALAEQLTTELSRCEALTAARVREALSMIEGARSEIASVRAQDSVHNKRASSDLRSRAWTHFVRARGAFAQAVSAVFDFDSRMRKAYSFAVRRSPSRNASPAKGRETSPPPHFRETNEASDL